MPTTITPALRAEHRVLNDALRKARREHTRLDNDRTFHAEQAAYDALADWAELNGLNYSVWDVRGTEDPTDAELRGEK